MKSWVRKIRLSYLNLFKLGVFCPGVGKRVSSF
ncbi:hypothetical protein N407_06815 [Helicobacter pylori FD662]|nr:hypothetical protein N407_06815 [Helicobacter pylori FD662]